VWIHRECGQDSEELSDAVAQASINARVGGKLEDRARDRWWEKGDDEGRQIENEGLRDDSVGDATQRFSLLSKPEEVT
jgi:hypothetical protein